ncbi:hypothetical protein SAMN04487972_1635 [Paracoccus halophilus]|uniref:Uncharacterized protein n=3 Tax=Paracoccus halophilus TaxID=376733 RepID=A0A099ET57_9RHOB|nr:hypothetical protein IT41_19750 [Paracoccus halophilus]SFA62710.1 hypothetical protein SAMN04487972_1635 [Paracoccus halophilus]
MSFSLPLSEDNMVIKFTKEQMNSAPMPDVEFAEWYVDEILRTEFPNSFRELGRVSCMRKTKSARRYLPHFGITRPDLQGQIMTVMWALGPNFFEHPAFNKILTDKHLTQDEKVDQVYKVSDEDGGQALDQADDRYWYPRLVPGNILGLKAYSEMTKKELWEEDIDPEDEDPWSIFKDG